MPALALLVDGFEFGGGGIIVWFARKPCLQKFDELWGLLRALVQRDQLSSHDGIRRVVLDGLFVQCAQVVPALADAKEGFQGIQRLWVGGVTLKHLAKGRDGFIAPSRILSEQAANAESHGLRFIGLG